MSKIDKLSILGVRSFSNIHHETIQFDTPLTLIVGYNGSGKTTIIECLKYATTGQLPPNSKGGAFVHDPKLCGEKEVLAQVKLSFKGTTGSRLVVTRSLQLTVKKLTRSMKTLEGQLLMIKDGERTTMSTRVAELDQLVPQYLGVSEAILDSVIFCHQDESLWPMSEPAALKKKFDEIFEAMKYTKAIENIKTLRKTQGTRLAELKIREETEKANKEKGDRVEKRARILEEEIDELRQKEAELSRDMEAARIEAGEKLARAKEALGIVNELKAKRERAGYLQENIDNLSDNFEELQESDQWLEATLAKYEERLAQLQEEKETVQGDYGNLQEQIRQSRDKVSIKLTEQGQHQAEKENHETQLNARTQLVKEAARRHAIRGYEDDLDESQIREFVERVRRASREKDKELERIRKATDDELRQTQTAVTELEGRRNARTQDRMFAQQAITANEKNVNGLQAKVDAICVDEGRKAVLEASYKNYEDQLRRATADFDSAAWDKQLRTENNKLYELENEFRRLREELLQSSRLAKDRASLEIKKDELKKLQQSLDTMVATHCDQLSSVIGPNWQLDSLEQDFQVVLDQRNRTLTDAKSQQEEINRDLSTAQFKCSSLKETIKKKKDELRRSQATVLSSITNSEGEPIESVDDFEENLDELQQSINQTEKDIANYEYVADFYTSSLTFAEKHDKCKLCERNFTDGKERTVVTDRLHNLIAKFAKDTMIAELEELNEVLPKALAARSHYETYKKLSKTEIPALEEELNKNENARASLLERISQQDSTVAEHHSAKNKVDGLKKTVDTISRYRSDMLNYETEIAMISTQQKLSGSTLTVDELEEQSSACDEQIRILRAKIEKIAQDKDRAKTLMNRLELDLRDAQTKLNNAGNELEKKQSFLARIEEYRENSTQQRDTIHRADVDLEALGPQLAKANARHEDAKMRGRAKEKEIHDQQKILADTVNKFTMVEDAINKYVDGGGPQNLVACQKSIKALEKEQKIMEAELLELTAKANELTKKLSESQRYERSIKDNLLYRKNLRNLNDLENEIAELEQRNVTDDYERLSRDATKTERLYQKLSAERGPIIGSMKAKDQELDVFLKEWETDYKNAAQNYREAHIKVETTKAAVEDLGRYGSALDAAIMKYHSVKMEEINRIAGELWQSTYQGTDVDTILIRSENENTASKRNYNYRVCMVKQDAEMDMRGRCSAGQRVLASIIIRLALAECFGVKCGIIALDEPTTNLDQDNIKSLAESLHNIIKIRRQQQNFQLIVITHDEEFLKYMKCPEFTDNYWRVSRDEKQLSTIEKQSMNEIMG